MGMDDGYDAKPSRPAPRQAPRTAGPSAATGPASNFSDMDDDIPF